MPFPTHCTNYVDMEKVKELPTIAGGVLFTRSETMMPGCKVQAWLGEGYFDQYAKNVKLALTGSVLLELLVIGLQTLRKLSWNILVKFL